METGNIASPDILMFVEDPGAANYIAGLPPLLAAQGLSIRLLTAGSATDYLAQRGIPSESISSYTAGANGSPSLISTSGRLSSFPPSLSSPFLLVGTSENPDTFGLEWMDRCRAAGGCSVGAVDAFANAAHRFRGRSSDPLAHAPDWLLVPDAWTRDAYISLGYSADRIVVCGHPHYDAVRTDGERMAGIGREVLRRKWFPDAAPDRPVLVFVAEISTGMDASEFRRSPAYTLHGWGENEGRTEIVLEEFLDAAALIQPRPYLVLRLHPKNTMEEFARYADRFDLVSEGGSPLELIYAAEGAVGMTSMLLLEAALLQRPTLAILPRETERDWLPTIRAALTPCATTRAELRRLLPQILLQTPPCPADINTVLPTHCGERATAFLARLFRSRL